jgi:hypothetical protein
MNEIFAILFGLPSILILAILAYIGVVGTMVSIYYAIKNKDYEYLMLVFTLTFTSAMLGWTIGSFI